MLDVAIRKADGTTAIDWSHVGVRTAPPLPVLPALRTILPDGLRRGSTVSVSGSIALLLALLGEASAGGAWCALVGFPRISAEAAREYGIELRRLALVPEPGAGWTTAVGALLDAVDVVAARPPGGRGLAPADVRRLAARVRSKNAVLVPYLVGDGPGGQWPSADVRLQARDGVWTGLGASSDIDLDTADPPVAASTGGGRLRARRIEVSASGRGRFADASRARTARLWLPADGGGCTADTDMLAPVIDLAG